MLCYFAGFSKSALGPYAHVADFETFLSRPHGSSHRTDVADLRGARFVCSVEVDDGKTMAQALVKNLTGGDEITVRSAYGRSGRTFRRLASYG